MTSARPNRFNTPTDEAHSLPDEARAMENMRRSRGKPMKILIAKMAILLELFLVGRACAVAEDLSESITIENRAGVHWVFPKTTRGWALGTISLHGRPIEQPATRGLLALRNVKNGEILWMPASEASKVNPASTRFSGRQQIDGVLFSWEAEVTLRDDAAAATFSLSWSVDKNLTDWEVCLAYHDSFSSDWRVQSYPWGGNSQEVAVTPLRYSGIPGVLVYRPDLSLVLLYAIDSNSDYLNPTTWTGKTSLYFANHRTAPQFRVGDGHLAAGTKYRMPLQLFLSDAGDFAGSITAIMQAWVKANDYHVDNSLKVRTPQEAFNLTVSARRQMQSWKPGVGYEHHRGAPFVYIGNNPYIAYFEYRLYELTGEKMWRERAIEQIDFAIKGQQPNGVFNTSYYFRKQKRPDGQTAEGFCSWDWNHNGFKVDINTWMARYILETWQLVKKDEGVDRQDWYKAATTSLGWVLANQNEDGGFPQVVDIQTGAKSESVVTGRTLVALPMIAQITGDERVLRASEREEQFLRQKVEGEFWYTGQHPDLPPGDFEQDSIYNVVEYWLDRYDRTGNKENLDQAVANAYFALLYWCPKQLSWVKNPTQGAHTEQEHYNQYSVYNYHNRKIQCLDRLYKATGNPLFEQLRDRVMQMNFFTQVTDGPYKGSLTEAIADPWLERLKGFDFRGSPYTSELVADLMLQLMDLKLVKQR